MKNITINGEFFEVPDEVASQISTLQFQLGMLNIELENKSRLLNSADKLIANYERDMLKA